MDAGMAIFLINVDIGASVSDDFILSPYTSYTNSLINAI
jgi:hypothetical protein